MTTASYDSRRTILPRFFHRTRIQKDYSRIAWSYDLWGRLTESKALDKVIELADVRDGESILEVAPGTGHLLQKISAVNRDGRTLGLDLSPHMLHQAQDRLADCRSGQLYQGSATHLPFKSGSFDLLLNTYMLDLLPESMFTPILREFSRVLKAEGRMIIASMTFGEHWFNRFWEWLPRRLPNSLTGCRPISTLPYLTTTGFTVVDRIYISQNTFPSEVVQARKIEE